MSPNPKTWPEVTKQSDAPVGSAGTWWWLLSGATGSASWRGAKADDRKIRRAFIQEPESPTCSDVLRWKQASSRTWEEGDASSSLAAARPAEDRMGQGDAGRA